MYFISNIVNYWLKKLKKILPKTLNSVMLIVDIVFMKRLWLLGKICGFLWVSASVFAEEPTKPDLVTPEDELIGVSCKDSAVIFRWRYNNDDEISSRIESQVTDVKFGLAKVPVYGRFGGEFVGKCIYGNISDNNEYFIGNVTKYKLSHCAKEDEKLELEPLKWYKWSVQARFNDGSSHQQTTWFQTRQKRVKINFDITKLNNLSWGTWWAGVSHEGETHTLQSIYEKGWIDLTFTRHPVDIPHTRPTKGYTRAELHSANWKMHQHEGKPNPGVPWLVHGLLVTKSAEDLTTDPRKTKTTMGLTIFAPDSSKTLMRVTPVIFEETVNKIYRDNGRVRSEWTIDQQLLHVAAHELGHALHLTHDDANVVNETNSQPIKTIMTKGSILTPYSFTKYPSKWKYEWSARSIEHFQIHELHRWAPNKSLNLTFSDKLAMWMNGEFSALIPNCH